MKFFVLYVVVITLISSIAYGYYEMGYADCKVDVAFERINNSLDRIAEQIKVDDSTDESNE